MQLLLIINMNKICNKIKGYEVNNGKGIPEVQK